MSFVRQLATMTPLWTNPVKIKTAATAGATTLELKGITANGVIPAGVGFLFSDTLGDFTFYQIMAQVTADASGFATITIFPSLLANRSVDDLLSAIFDPAVRFVRYYEEIQQHTSYRANWSGSPQPVWPNQYQAKDTVWKTWEFEWRHLSDHAARQVLTLYGTYAAATWDGQMSRRPEMQRTGDEEFSVTAWVMTGTEGAWYYRHFPGAQITDITVQPD